MHNAIFCKFPFRLGKDIFSKDAKVDVYQGTVNQETNIFNINYKWDYGHKLGKTHL